MTTTTNRRTGLSWLFFFISVAAFFVVYAVGGGYCSLVLPFVLTSFALALDLM